MQSSLGFGRVPQLAEPRGSAGRSTSPRGCLVPRAVLTPSWAGGAVLAPRIKGTSELPRGQAVFFSAEDCVSPFQLESLYVWPQSPSAAAVRAGFFPSPRGRAALAGWAPGALWLGTRRGSGSSEAARGDKRGWGLGTQTVSHRVHAQSEIPWATARLQVGTGCRDGRSERGLSWGGEPWRCPQAGG